MRHKQFLPSLWAAGIEVEVAPFFDDGYLQVLYAGRRPALANVLAGYLRRLAVLRRRRRFDLLWIEKEVVPWLPFGLERLILGRTPYVVDYDDAWFHRYDSHTQPLVRWTLGDKIDRVMQCATVVTVGNEYLAERAKAAGARRVMILPTVIELDRYQIAVRDPAAPFTLGWIGTPVTARYLQLVAVPLAALCREHRVRVRLIGAGKSNLPEVPADCVPWSEDTEIAQLQSADVGIMPLADTPWERGKCGYKLIQSMALARPVVASPVGVNLRLIEPGVSGFLAASEAEWLEALIRLRYDPSLCYTIGAAARRVVEQRYTTSIITPVLVRTLIEAADASP